MTSKKVVEEGSVGGKKTEGGRERERDVVRARGRKKSCEKEGKRLGGR